MSKGPYFDRSVIVLCSKATVFVFTSAEPRGNGVAGDGYMGPFRGGLTSKIHAIVDAEGRPINLCRTGDQVLTALRLKASWLVSKKATRCLRTKLTTPMPSARPQQNGKLGELCFNRIKHYRGIAPRYDKNPPISWPLPNSSLSVSGASVYESTF
ncbi:transposase [Brucella haematophila]|nr:transposase [Brucella haematophila]